MLSMTGCPSGRAVRTLPEVRIPGHLAETERSTMRKILSILLAGLMLVTGAVTAHANEPDLSALSEQAHAQNAALPNDVSGLRFWSGQLCVQSGANTSGYPIAYQAQQWNLRVGNQSVLAINHRASCSAAGYPPSRSFTVGVYSGPNDPHCSTILNGQTSYHNGMYRWTSHPVILINYGYPGCTSSTARIYHNTAASIGILLGMKAVDWPNSLNRVMNSAQWSQDNVLYPTPGEGDRVWSIYTGAYGG